MPHTYRTHTQLLPPPPPHTHTGTLEGGEVRAGGDVGLPSTKSPLQLFGERLAASQRLAAQAVAGAGAGVAAPLDLYLAVPRASMAAVRAHLGEHRHWGLQPSQVGAGRFTRGLVSAL